MQDKEEDEQEAECDAEEEMWYHAQQGEEAKPAVEVV